MENQGKVITLGALGKYDNLRPQVQPVSATYAEMAEMRQQGKLIPGQYYRITDYVTTVNAPTNPNARSAGHAFDIIVRADDPTTLNEQAWAIPHSGDTYFEGARLEAWELKYRLDNVDWSQQAGTYCVGEENGYSFRHIGTIELGGTTYQLWKGDAIYSDDWADYAVSLDTEEGSQLYAYYGDPEEFDPDELEVVDTLGTVTVQTADGKGTIYWMKDEHGNECPYDFKNIQFKRWLATDSVSERDGLEGKYMVGNPDDSIQGLSVEDTEDFIWAFTFSSDNSGGEQTDYSLTDGHGVHGNVIGKKDGGHGLPDNTFFGENNYLNQIGDDCYANSWGNDCQYNSWGNSCFNNSWGNGCYSNSWGNNNRYNSWGNDCYSNSWGNDCGYNSWGNGCQYNSWGNDCFNNSWGNNVTQSTYFDGVQYTQITTENVKNVQVLNGVAGTSSSKLTLGFAANKTYTQVACKNSSNVLKIYVPGDLV